MLEKDQMYLPIPVQDPLPIVVNDIPKKRDPVHIISIHDVDQDHSPPEKRQKT